MSENVSQNANILFDEGAQRSFLTEDYASKLQLKITGSETLNIAGFGAKEVTRHVNTATVHLLCDSGEKVPINVVIVPLIATPLHTNYKTTETLPYLRNLKLAHPSSTDMTFDISLLIGADHYWDIIGNDIIRGDGPTAVSSKIGYLLSGPSHMGKSTKNATAYNILTYHTNEEVDLEKFWRYEEMGVVDKAKENNAFSENSIVFENGHYVAKLPWKDNCCELPTNEKIARKRTEGVIRRISREPKLLEMYNDIIQDQEKRGFIEKVETENDNSESRVHYIPHHPVSKNSVTTPIRIVYDCSCRAHANSPNLNDCLESTPPQLNSLTAILTRFRANRYAVTADIEKAFLQIGLDESDRDVTRFFWLSDVKDVDSPLIVYRFKVVLFGATCSPFLLDAALRKHFTENPSCVADELSKSLYVDNALTSFTDEETLIRFYEKSRELLQAGGFKLRSWNSNNLTLRDIANRDDVLDADKHVKILGLRWDFDTDKLLFQKTSFNTGNEGGITKREILKGSSKIFDPLGLLSPVTVNAKILMQDMWKESFSWDEQLPQHIQNRWLNLAKELEQCTSIEIPRYLKLGSCNEQKSIATLHVFTDASLRVYGANAYLVTDNVSALVMAKNRLAPMHKTTLPRLELMGAVTGAKLANHLVSELDVKSVVFWCDSQIVLHWLMSEKPVNKFVKNRKTEICELTEPFPCTWRYIPTKDNPADLQTRGITTKDLQKNDLWMHGPHWITDSAKWPEWKVLKTTIKSDNDDNEKENTTNLATQTTNVTVPGVSEVIETSKYGDLGKLLRITSYVLRFVRNCKRTRAYDLRRTLRGTLPTEHIQPSEMSAATMLWIKDVQNREFASEITEMTQNNTKKCTLVKQLKLYIDDTGLIRCRGRIDNSSVVESAKNPILLPKKHTFTKMIVKDIHGKLLHAGCSQTVTELRQTYWIPSIRQCVNHVLKSCVQCQKVLQRPYKLPDPPQLPKDRVEDCVPFSVTGVDYAGPLYVKDNGVSRKVYICLFTCATSRAIHLELVNDLSTETFILAFRRFISNNGTPHTVYSDNAATFLAAPKEILRTTGITIRWKYIPKGAPWHGGFWERMVGLTKTTIKKVLGKALVNFDILRTLINEITSVINDRPLTYVSSNLEDAQPLTPSHLLGGRKRNLSHLYEDNDIPVQLDVVSANKYYQRKNEILDHFTQRWKSEYLTRLREYHQTSGRENQEVRIGDIVQIHDTSPRVNWRLGIITDVITGSDGLVRSAKLRTANGFITSRPVNKLYPLEL